MFDIEGILPKAWRVGPFWQDAIDMSMFKDIAVDVCSIRIDASYAVVTSPVAYMDYSMNLFGAGLPIAVLPEDVFRRYCPRVTVL